MLTTGHLTTHSPRSIWLCNLTVLPCPCGKMYYTASTWATLTLYGSSSGAEHAHPVMMLVLAQAGPQLALLGSSLKTRDLAEQRSSRTCTPNKPLLKGCKQTADQHQQASQSITGQPAQQDILSRMISWSAIMTARCSR
jgi:hypothetical protein